MATTTGVSEVYIFGIKSNHWLPLAAVYMMAWLDNNDAVLIQTTIVVSVQDMMQMKQPLVR